MTQPGRRQHRVLRCGVEAYLDGEVGPGLAVQVRRHLDECWECSQDAEWLMLIKATLPGSLTAAPQTWLSPG